MKLGVVAALLVTTGFAVAACGGGSEGQSEEAKVEEVVNGYYAAWHRLDGSTVCEKLTQAHAEEIAAFSSSCNAPFEKRWIVGKVPELHKTTSVEIRGDSATVRTDDEATLQLKREGGEWLIASSDFPTPSAWSESR